ncbi:DUF302 domain-containing protein [Roseobacter sp. HKCCA0434]|uniref:DUF302 domain-containing protein n=1 Tax=Roseobacter sp. HKCCA0434 TaxID=3079297 RepID=UPI002905A338|nr:DUF302 domain-containing protein [Roseobacter sp. HKCCA0434]
MRLALAACAVLWAGSAEAQEIVTHAFEGSYDDATFAVENAIIGQGLVIDSVSHVGDMLSRTAADVGSDQMLFENAEVMLFCSARVSREVMEADPLNIAYCPYGIFVTEREGAVEIGYRTYPDGPMDAVEDLLDTIARDALGG